MFDPTNSLNRLRSIYQIFSVLFLVFALFTGMFSPAQADPDQNSKFISVGGSLQIRGESRDDFSFGADTSTNDENFLLSQLRVNLDVQPAKNVRLFLEGQDARIFGEQGIDDDATPNFYQDSFDVNRAFGDIMFSAGNLPLRIRVGRQWMNLGDKRLISSFGWGNTFGPWDGIRVTAGEQKERTLDGFVQKGPAPDPDDFNDWSSVGNALYDSEYYGLYYTDWKLLNDGQFESFWILRNESSRTDRVHTLGARFEKSWGAWDANGQAAYQFGEYTDLDHEAYALHLGGGYKIPSIEGARVGVNYDYASGDEDPTDGDHETFDNLQFIPLNHAYYGYMDFFSLQNLHHLSADFSKKITKALNAGVSWHEFWLDQEDSDSWYNAGRGVVRDAGGTNVRSHVGSELDFTLKYGTEIAGKDTNFLFGYSHFFTGDYVGDTGPDSDADYLYLQMKITF